MAIGPVADPRTFVVIPTYNEAMTVREVVEHVAARYPSIEIVVVDDGSTDDTPQQIEGLGVHLLRHIVNRGQGASLQTGIRFALEKGADVIVTFDADGQHDPKDIAALVEPIVRGDCAVCLGSRFLGGTRNMPLLRRWVLKGGVLFTRFFSGIRVTDVHNGLRAFSREAAQSLSMSLDRMAHASEILDHIKRQPLTFQEVPVEISYSSHTLEKGQSSWAALKIALQLLHQRLLE